MKEVIKKHILHILGEASKILERKEAKDVDKLRDLSDHAIEDVALHKTLDIISITVLIYSIYKVVHCLKPIDYQELIITIKKAEKDLLRNNFGGYNRNIKVLYTIVGRCDKKVREHLQDVMQAAKIKKGAVLLQHGLSIGQAAGLMGLSNWDLQSYAAKTTALEMHQEKIPAKKRLARALEVFQ